MEGLNENEELKSIINGFRISDLQSLLGGFKTARTGRKQELQERALKILKNRPPHVDLVLYAKKIRELYQKELEEARQTNGVDIPPQQSRMQMQQTMAGSRGHQQQQQRSNMNPYASNPYSHQVQQSRPGAPGSNPIAYPGGGSMGNFPANNYSSSIYNSHLNAPPVPPAPMNQCNITDNVQLFGPPLSQANIMFRKLPFYKVKHQVLKPIILTANSNLSLPPTVRTSANQEFQIQFLLSCDMASELAMHRDITKNDYGVQAQIRISAVDGNVPNTVTEYDDFLPLGLVIRVNNRQCNTLPPCAPTSRQGVESRRIPRPINVAPLIKMSPVAANHIVINWASEVNKTFVLTLNLVEKLTSDFLLNKLKERPTISIDITKLSIREQYKRVIDDDDDDAGENADADDDDIATTIVRVSLLCPLAKFRMMYPAKGKNCSHLQCFDGAAYISLNEKKPMWMCPVCSRPLYYDDLILDQYFMDVLRNDQLSDDCQEVQLFVDGTWKSYDEDATDNKYDKQNSSKDTCNSPNASPSQAISVSNSTEVDESVDRKDIAVAETVTLTADLGPSVVESVVDLTCEDEEISDSTEISPAPGNKTNENLNAVSTNDTATSNNDLPKENVTTEISRSSPTSQSTIEARCTSTPLLSTRTSSNAPSTVSNNSGCNSPGIISLDSPSPPTFPSSPQSNAIAALNIDDS